MSLEKAKCGKCGTILDVDSEKGLFTCPNCHDTFLVSAAIENYKAEVRANKNADRFMKITAGVIIAIILMVLFTTCDCSNACSCDQGYDYYYDANGNGKMDKGEYVYSEDSDGNVVGYDADGDGWWD